MYSRYIKPQTLFSIILMSIWAVHFVHTMYYLDDVSGWIWSQNLVYPEGTIAPWQPIGEHDGLEIYVLFISTFLIIALTYGLITMSRFSIRRVFAILLFLSFCEQAMSLMLWFYGTRAKAESIVLNIKQNTTLQQASIIFIDNDEFLLDIPYSVISLRKHISPHIFSVASNDKTQLIIPNLAQENQHISLNQTSFPHINLLGCQAKIVIFKGDRQHDLFGLVIRYWGMLLFKPYALEAYLSSLTYLRVTPIHSDAAQSCSAW